MDHSFTFSCCCYDIQWNYTRCTSNLQLNPICFVDRCFLSRKLTLVKHLPDGNLKCIFSRQVFGSQLSELLNTSCPYIFLAGVGSHLSIHDAVQTDKFIAQRLTDIHPGETFKFDDLSYRSAILWTP